MNIYILTFPNSKVYIGQTNNFNKRMSHYKNLSCSGQPAVFNAIKKYKWENIQKEILLECDMEYTDFFENAFIFGYNSINKKFGYNLNSGGNKNKKYSADSKLKMSISHIGKKFSEETKRKQRDAHLGEKNYLYGKHLTREAKEKLRIAQSGEKNHNFGRKFSDDIKNKMSIAKMGKNISEATKKKLSEINSGEKHPMFGKLHSKESKLKMSIAKLGNKYNLGKKHSQETLQKLRNANEGKKLSAETKLKISKSLTGKKNTEESKLKSSMKMKLYWQKKKNEYRVGDYNYEKKENFMPKKGTKVIEI